MDSGHYWYSSGHKSGWSTSAGSAHRRARWSSGRSSADERALRRRARAAGPLSPLRCAAGCPLRRSGTPPAAASIAGLLLVFSQELAALLKAGLPLLQSLDVMLERQRDALLRQSLATVREKVKSGVALSDAFRHEGELYPPIFSASLVAGERSGQPGGGAAPLLAVPAPQPDAQEEGDLGRRLPGRAALDDGGAGRRHDADGRSRSSRSFYEGLERRAAAADPDPAWPSPRRCARNLLWIVLGFGVPAWSVAVLAPAARAPGVVLDRGAAPPALLRRPDADVRDQPARAHAVRRCSRAACRS